MKTFVYATVLLFSLNLLAQEFPAKGYSDQTDKVMKDQSKNLELLEEKTVGGIQIKLFLSKSAKAAINKQAFLVKDPDYNQQKLNDFIFKTFETSLIYFRAIAPGDEVKELNLVIVDQGGDKGTISEVPVHSRVIQLHLVRWHKYLLKNNEHYVAVSSIHEFGHIINYMYSPKETKLHRELSSVMLESLNFIQLYGIEVFTKGYLYYYTSKFTDLSVFLNSDYMDMNVLRTMSHYLFTNIYNGAYKGSAEARELTEKLVVDYIKNPLDDVKGLNKVLEQSGLLDGNGKTLTFATLQRDSQRFCQASKECAP